MHRRGEARQALYDVLRPLLPDGRVSAYPADEDVGVQVWVGDPTTNANSSVGPATQINLDFPVHVTFDGSPAAQSAGLDDLVSRVWDACERASLTFPLRSNPGIPLLGAGGGTRSHEILTVRRMLAARTLCLPEDPLTAEIPPELVEA